MNTRVVLLNCITIWFGDLIEITSLIDAGDANVHHDDVMGAFQNDRIVEDILSHDPEIRSRGTSTLRRRSEELEHLGPLNGPQWMSKVTSPDDHSTHKFNTKDVMTSTKSSSSFGWFENVLLDWTKMQWSDDDPHRCVHSIATSAHGNTNSEWMLPLTGIGWNGTTRSGSTLNQSRNSLSFHLCWRIPAVPQNRWKLCDLCDPHRRLGRNLCRNYSNTGVNMALSSPVYSNSLPFYSIIHFNYSFHLEFYHLISDWHPTGRSSQFYSVITKWFLFLFWSSSIPLFRFWY